MKNAVLAGLIMALVLFVPPFLLPGRGAATAAVPPQEDEKPVKTPSETAVSTASRRDADVTLRVQVGEQIEEMTLASYLPGVVRGEMYPAFEQAALAAQAVAERTYVCYQLRAGTKDAHPDADVCTDPRCCSAWLSEADARRKWGDSFDRYEEKIDRAVQETDGQILLYDGAPILAVFHSSSSGVTANSGDVWVSDLPYLKSVASPENEETVPDYYSVVTVKPEDFRRIVLSAYPEADLSGAASGWITDVTENSSGRVESLRVGGVPVSGTQMRSLFSLRSACFSVSAGEEIVFRVTGYGHGVGMSQYGANELARQGKTWREILFWYYTDVTVGDMP